MGHYYYQTMLALLRAIEARKELTGEYFNVEYELPFIRDSY